MTGQETLQPKKRGPKPSGIGTPIQVRLAHELLATLDAWIAAQDDPQIGRPEAIRRILREALKRN